MAKKVLAFICCVALISGIPVLAAPAFAANSAAAAIVVSSEFAQVGETITVKVAINQVTDLYGVQFALKFDADLVEPDGNFVTFPAEYLYVHDENADLTCAACTTGLTPVYPLVRRNLGDKGLKTQVVVAEFSFKAKRAGTAQFGLEQLKAVSSELYTNQNNRPDVRVIPVQPASPVSVSIRSGSGAPNSPGSGSTGTPTVPSLDDIRNESDPAKAAESLISLIRAGVSEEIRAEVEQLAETWLVVLHTVAPSEQVEMNGQSYAVLDEADIERNIRLAQDLLKAAQEGGLALQVPAAVTIEAGESGDADILLAPGMLNALAENKLGVTVRKSGAELQFAAGTIVGETGSEAEGFKGVVILIKRSNGQPEAVSGSQYLPGAEYLFEAYRIYGDRVESFDSFDEPVMTTVEYDPQGLDIEKVGFYYFNEASGEWEYVRAIRHDMQNYKLTVALKHFSRYAVMEFSRSYSDIADLYPEAVRAIDVLSAHHLVNGVDDSRFAPKREMTRAEFVVMLSRLLDWDTATYSGGFRDVKSGDWFADAVETASRLGVVKGYNSSFNPHAPITREEMVTMLMRALPSGSSASNGPVERFDDDAQISDWAREAVYWAKANGLVKGTGANKFNPKANTKRADMAVLFYNVMKSLHD